MLSLPSGSTRGGFPLSSTTCLGCVRGTCFVSSPLRQAAWSHAHEGRSFVLVLLPCVLLGSGWLQRWEEMLLWQAVLASRPSLFVELLPLLTPELVIACSCE